MHHPFGLTEPDTTRQVLFDGLKFAQLRQARPPFGDPRYLTEAFETFASAGDEDKPAKPTPATPPARTPSAFRRERGFVNDPFLGIASSQALQ